MVLGLLDQLQDLPTVVSNRVARSFNRYEDTGIVTLDISKAFDRVWHAGLLDQLKSYDKIAFA